MRQSHDCRGLLEGDARLVRRERRALQVRRQHAAPARLDAALHEIALLPGTERRVDAVVVMGERDAPEVEVLRLEDLAVTETRKSSRSATVSPVCRLTIVVRVEKFPGLYESPLTNVVIAPQHAVAGDTCATRQPGQLQRLA